MSKAEHPISACIVTYKSPVADVVRAVDSLLTCDLPMVITIVDNDSGSRYRAELTAALSGRAGVAIVDSGMNKGFGAAHNLGFMRSASISDFHLVVNPDIIVPPGQVEKMVAYMKAHADIGLLAPKVVNEHGEQQYLCKRYPTVLALFGRRFLPSAFKNLPAVQSAIDHYQMRDMDYTKVMEPDFLSGCFMCFSSAVFSKLHGFDERFFLYFEDTDITLRAKKICRAIYYPEAYVIHAWKGGAKTSKKLTLIMIQSAIKFFNKWGWKWK